MYRSGEKAVRSVHSRPEGYVAVHHVSGPRECPCCHYTIARQSRQPEGNLPPAPLETRRHRVSQILTMIINSSRLLASQQETMDIVVRLGGVRVFPVHSTHRPQTGKLVTAVANAISPFDRAVRGLLCRCFASEKQLLSHIPTSVQVYAHRATPYSPPCLRRVESSLGGAFSGFSPYLRMRVISSCSDIILLPCSFYRNSSKRFRPLDRRATSPFAAATADATTPLRATPTPTSRRRPQSRWPTGGYGEHRLTPDRSHRSGY
jgi:hypothetical protein